MLEGIWWISIYRMRFDGQVYQDAWPGQRLRGWSMRSTSRSSLGRAVRFLSDRYFGVGFDQLLVVEAPSSSGVDFRYRSTMPTAARSSSAVTARVASCASGTTAPQR